MPSLDDHFRALTNVRPPDWPDLGEREPRPLAPPPGLRQRVGVAVLALAVAAAGFVFAIRAFTTEGRAPTPSSTVENGLIAFSRGGADAGLYAMNPDGTGIRRLPSERGDTDAAWSPDGSKIAFVGFHDGGAGLYAMSADGSGVRQLTDGGSDGGPAWSPDGTRIAFAREARELGAEVANADIYVVNADGTDLVRLTEDPVMEYSPAWSPDGSRIAFVGYHEAFGGQPPSPVRLYVMNQDGTDIRALSPEDVLEPAWSPDGSEIAYVDAQTGLIMAIQPDGTGQRRIIDAAQLVGGVHLVFGPTWSPDGIKIAFAAGPNAGDTHIYVVNRDGSSLTQLTDDVASDAEPAWQPVRVAGASVTPTASPSESSAPSVGPDPSADVHIAPFGQASSLLYAFDSIWVAWYEESGAKITRIDAATNEVVATIGVEDVPGWVGGGGGIAEGFGSIWVAGGTRQGAILQRIDPASNRLTATIPLGGQPGSLGADVAVDQTGVWVAVSELHIGGSSSLLRIDPGSNEVVAEMPLEYEYERQVIAVNGTIVVRQLHWHDDGSGPNTIFTSIDARTNTVTASTSENEFWGMWAWNDEAWAGVWSESQGYGFVRVDPMTLSEASDRVPFEAERIGSFEVGEGGIWFVTAAGVNQWQQPVKVDRFNSDTGRVDVSEKVPEAGGQDMAVGGGAIWFLKDGNVLRFDLG